MSGSKKILIPLLLLLMHPALFAQIGIYSIKVKWTPNERYLAKVSPNTGNSIVLSPSSIFEWYVTNGSTTTDVKNGIFYVKVTDSARSEHSLCGIDLNSGNVVSNPPLPNPDDIHQMEYNCKDGFLYAIKVNWDPNERFLVKINPTTAEITTISSSSIFDWYATEGATALDVENGIYYVKTRDEFSSEYSLFGISLETGNVVSKLPLDNPDDIHQMVFNCKDGFLYAIKVNWNPNERFLVKINPATGEIKTLSSSSIFDWYETNAGTTIDVNNGIFYAKGRATGSSEHLLYRISIETGDVISKALLSNTDDVHQMIYNGACVNTQDFHYEHSCYKDTTRFYPIISNSKTVEWDFGDPMSGSNNYSTDINSTHVFSDTGYFDIKLKSQFCCCTDSIIKTIYIGSINQEVSLPNDTILCDGDSLLLDLSYLIPPYYWQDSSTSASKSLSDPGTYFASESNCNTSDTVTISYTTKPIFDLGEDTSICQNQAIILHASFPNSTYLWNDLSTNSLLIINNNESGEHSVQVQNNCGSSFDTISVIYERKPLFDLGKDTSICQNTSITINASYPNANYLWNNNSTDSIMTIEEAGQYTVKVSNKCGSSPDTIVILVDLLPNFELGNDTTICLGQTLTLDASTSNSDYLWNDNSTDSTLTVNEAGAYAVTATNRCGALSDQIEVLFHDCQIVLEFPNIFTPNGDEKNELFTPSKINNIESLSITIYNRWGSQVYTTSDLNINWDGKDDNGQRANDGVYFWVVQYVDVDGNTLTQRGTLTMVR